MAGSIQMAIGSGALGTRHDTSSSHRQVVDSDSMGIPSAAAMTKTARAVASPHTSRHGGSAPTLSRGAREHPAIPIQPCILVNVTVTTVHKSWRFAIISKE